MPTELKLADFTGPWNLSRVIRHADQPEARFEGSAVWREEGDGLTYHETGQLILPGHPVMQAERRYLWRAPLEVFFEDGRFFHSVDTAGAQSVHLCDPDTYRVRYDFTGWPMFRSAWKVSGPKKNYQMSNVYTRK